jgi:3-methyladenine DNA glycosylase AlkC
MGLQEYRQAKRCFGKIKISQNIVKVMAIKMKDYYNKETAELLAHKILVVQNSFNVDGFVQDIVVGIENKEFLERQDVYVDAFEKYLGNNYENNIMIFTKILGEKLKESEGMFKIGYWLWPVGRYIERHGLKNFDLSMDFIYELTQRFTGEFAVRNLVMSNPQKALKTMEKWSKDSSQHVRRCASEGMRISLPWGKKMLEAVGELELFTKILTNLKNDPEKFVQKSVGNNLNDLYKLYPDKANQIISNWQSEPISKETQWIIKHGIRSTKKY